MGVSFLDTAMSYRVGTTTKFGIVRGPNGVHRDGRPDHHIRGYCDSSLARLGIEVIDVYHLHRADLQVPVAETVRAMVELVTPGKVRRLSLCEVNPEDDLIPLAPRFADSAPDMETYRGQRPA